LLVFLVNHRQKSPGVRNPINSSSWKSRARTAIFADKILELLPICLGGLKGRSGAHSAPTVDRNRSQKATIRRSKSYHHITRQIFNCGTANRAAGSVSCTKKFGNIELYRKATLPAPLSSPGTGNLPAVAQTRSRESRAG